MQICALARPNFPDLTIILPHSFSPYSMSRRKALQDRNRSLRNFSCCTCIFLNLSAATSNTSYSSDWRIWGWTFKNLQVSCTHLNLPLFAFSYRCSRKKKGAKCKTSSDKWDSWEIVLASGADGWRDGYLPTISASFNEGCWPIFISHPTLIF